MVAIPEWLDNRIVDAIASLVAGKSGSSRDNYYIFSQVRDAVCDIQTGCNDGWIRIRPDGRRKIFYNFVAKIWIRRRLRSSTGPCYEAIIKSVAD